MAVRWNKGLTGAQHENGLKNQPFGIRLCASSCSGEEGPRQVPQLWAVGDCVALWWSNLSYSDDSMEFIKAIHVPRLARAAVECARDPLRQAFEASLGRLRAEC